MFKKKKKTNDNIYARRYNRYVISLASGRHIDERGRKGKRLTRADRDYMNGFIDGHDLSKGAGNFQKKDNFQERK